MSSLKEILLFETFANIIHHYPTVKSIHTLISVEVADNIVYDMAEIIKKYKHLKNDIIKNSKISKSDINKLHDCDIEIQDSTTVLKDMIATIDFNLRSGHKLNSEYDINQATKVKTSFLKLVSIFEECLGEIKKFHQDLRDSQNIHKNAHLTKNVPLD